MQCTCFDCFTRKGCPQIIVHTDRLKWPVAEQWEHTFVKGIAVVCEISIIEDRIQSQKVVYIYITSSLKV